MTDIKAQISRLVAAQSKGDVGELLRLSEDGVRQFPDALRFKQSKLIALRLAGAFEDAWEFGASLPLEHQVSPQVILPLTLAGLDAGRLEDLDRIIGQAEATNPDHPQILLSRVTLTLERSGPKSALALLDEREQRPHPDTALGSRYLRLLIEVGRVSEAREMYRNLLDTNPTPKNILQFISFLNSSHEFDEASRLLQENSELADTEIGWHRNAIECAWSSGQAVQALNCSENAIKVFPKSTDLQRRHQRLLAAAGRQKEAEDSCRTFAELNKGLPTVQIDAARFLSRSKSDEEVDALFGRAVDLGQTSPKNAILRSELLLANKDAAGAHEVLCDFAKEREFLPGIQLRLARIEATALGLLDEAIRRLQNILSMRPDDGAALMLLAGCFVTLELYDEANDVLARVPEDVPKHRAGRYQILAEIAENRGELSSALEYIKEVCALRPQDRAPLTQKSRIEMFLGDLKASWKTQQQVSRLYTSVPNKNGTGIKPMRSLQGQILNEFRLQFLPNSQAVHSTMPAPDTPVSDIRHIAAENPDSVAWSLIHMAALNKAGEIGKSPNVVVPETLGESIPKQVFQFWDSPDLPSQVADLMNANKNMNPDFEFRRFDQRSADAYIREKGELASLRAFRLSKFPAGKADIFRLVVLFYEGGVYMDADDRCLQRLNSFVDTRLRFIGYQEKISSIGNNFLAVPPKSPIIRSALDMASTAFEGGSGESLWLSTGPGAISRSVVLHGTQTDGYFSEGIWIMTNGQFRRRIAPHVQLSYKSGSKHWFRQFSRGSTEN